MIIINLKVFFVIFLVVLSFSNNFIVNYDELFYEESYKEICLIQINPSIKSKPYFLDLIKHIIYFIFFYNIDNPKSLFNNYLIGGHDEKTSCFVVNNCFYSRN